MPQTPYVTPKPSLGPDLEDKKALRAAEACTLVLLRRPVPTLALSQKSALVQGALGRGGERFCWRTDCGGGCDLAPHTMLSTSHRWGHNAAGWFFPGANDTNDSHF